MSGTVDKSQWVNLPYRCAFHRNEDDGKWKVAVQIFPNGIPNFSGKDEAEEFIKRSDQI